MMKLMYATQKIYLKMIKNITRKIHYILRHDQKQWINAKSVNTILEISYVKNVLIIISL